MHYQHLLQKLFKLVILELHFFIAVQQTVLDRSILNCVTYFTSPISLFVACLFFFHFAIRRGISQTLELVTRCHLTALIYRRLLNLYFLFLLNLLSVICIRKAQRIKLIQIISRSMNGSINVTGSGKKGEKVKKIKNSNNDSFVEIIDFHSHLSFTKH